MIFFLYLLFVFRKVTSQPCSRIPGNRSFRHIVCSVEVLVKGASQQLPEVRDALGSAPLERLTLKQTIHVPTLQTLTPTPHAFTSHTQANTSTPTLGTYKNDADDDSDTTIMYESPQPDSDKTVLPYDSDETVLPTRLCYLLTVTRLCYRMTVTRLYYLLNLTIQKNFSVNQTAVHH